MIGSVLNSIGTSVSLRCYGQLEKIQLTCTLKICLAIVPLSHFFNGSPTSMICILMTNSIFFHSNIFNQFSYVDLSCIHWL